MKSKDPSNPFLRPAIAPATWLLALALTHSAHAASGIWDGSSGSILTNTANWSSNALPNGVGDTATWNGTAGGSLVLSATTQWTTTGTNLGVNLSLTSAQTGSVSITQGGATAQALSINSITVASSAGALTLASTGSGQITFRNQVTNSNTFTNDSNNAVTFAAGTKFASGGGAARTVDFGGSGNWQMDANLVTPTGSVAVTKSGGGTLTFASTSQYTGNTSVTNGKLIVNGNISTSSTTVSGGSLGGSGTVGAVNIQAAGTLDFVDNTIADLNTGNLTLAGTSNFEISATANTADQAISSAILVFGGTLNVSNIAGTLADGQSFDLFNWGSTSGAFSSVALPTLTGGLTWDQTQLYSTGTITVVPEPNIATLLGGLGVLALLRRRR
jgi:autotransporter-associated beta strand protein